MIFGFWDFGIFAVVARCLIIVMDKRAKCAFLRVVGGEGEHRYTFKSLRLRPPTPEAYGKTADFGTLCIPGSSQRRDPSAALLSSSDRSRLAALNVNADSLSCPLTQLYIPGVPGRVQRGSRGSRGFATSRKHEKLDKRSGAVCQAYYAASSIVCRGFQ